MTEQTPADGNDSTATYEDHFEEAAREEAGQAPKAGAPRDADDRHGHEDGTGTQDSGQPSDAEGRQQPDAQGPAGSEGTDDLWLNADPRLREAFEAERKEREKAQNLHRSNLERYRRDLAELRSRTAATPKPAAQQGQERPAELDEKLKRVKEDYPDLADAVDEIGTLRSKLANLEADATQRQAAEAVRAELEQRENRVREEQSLTDAHPDWQEQVLTPAFAEWIQVQPRMVIEALNRNGTAEHGIVDHVEAAKILSDFKRDTAAPAAADPLAERRNAQLEGSRHIPAKVPALETRPIGGGTHEEEFEAARQEELRAARR